MPSVKTLISKRWIRITLGANVIEAELCANATADALTAPCLLRLKARLAMTK